MKDVKKLQGPHDIDHAGAQTTDQGARRTLLRNQCAEDGGDGDEDQQNDRQFHGREKGPDRIFLRQNGEPLLL